jgi:hypothetical protein
MVSTSAAVAQTDISRLVCRRIQLFFAADSHGRSATDSGRYTPDDDHLELITLPVGGTMSFIPLDLDEAAVFLEGAQPVRR